jgi:hypothetical protein
VIPDRGAEAREIALPAAGGNGCRRAVKRPNAIRLRVFEKENRV